MSRKWTGMFDPDYYVRPYQDQIRHLERVLSESPCMLIIRKSDAILEVVGYGDRVMALELERYRRALDDIATGKVSDKNAAEFATNALERQ